MRRWVISEVDWALCIIVLVAKSWTGPRLLLSTLDQLNQGWEKRVFKNHLESWVRRYRKIEEKNPNRDLVLYIKDKLQIWFWMEKFFLRIKTLIILCIKGTQEIWFCFLNFFLGIRILITIRLRISAWNFIFQSYICISNILTNLGFVRQTFSSGLEPWSGSGLRFYLEI